MAEPPPDPQHMPPQLPPLLRPRKRPRPTIRPEDERLSLPFYNRLLLASTVSGGIGFLLGASHGSRTASLRFRAENSHRLPNTERGWYLYHKSKNHVVVVASVKEGARMAGRLAVWTGIFFAVEEVLDRSRCKRDRVIREWEDGGSSMRGRRDFLSTITAGMTTSAAFSVWSELLCACVAWMEWRLAGERADEVQIAFRGQQQRVQRSWDSMVVWATDWRRMHSRCCRARGSSMSIISCG